MSTPAVSRHTGCNRSLEDFPFDQQHLQCAVCFALDGRVCLGGSHPSRQSSASMDPTHTSPRLTNSVYIICDTKLTAACGTCFVVSPTLIVTAYHNLSLKASPPKNWIIAKGLERDEHGKITALGTTIPVAVFRTSMKSDWTLLTRTDNLTFDAGDIVPIHADADPEPETRVKIYHCALDLFRDGRVSAVKPMSVDARVGYYTGHKLFFQVALFGGSSGGLIALQNSTALGMHLEGINYAMLGKEYQELRQLALTSGTPFPPEDDITLTSDSNAQAMGVLSEGLVLNKFKNLMREL